MKDKHVYEGWYVSDYISELEPSFNLIVSGQSWMNKKELFKDDLNNLKKWCIDNQPYYKKHIPEVFNYFKNKLNETK